MKLDRVTILSAVAAVLCAGCSANPDTPQASGGDIRPNPADGQLLSENLGVPERVSGEFVSESGISRVIVDADIIFPEAVQADIVEAVPRVFTGEEIASVISRYEDEIGWYHVQGEGAKYAGEMPAVEYTSGGVNMYNLWINNIPGKMTYNTGRDTLELVKERLTPEQAENYEFSYINVGYGLLQSAGKIGWTPELTYNRNNEGVERDMLLPLTNGRAEDCTISLEEAAAVADKEVHAILPDYQMSAYGQLPQTELGSKKKYYIFRYTRHLNGIPVNDSYGGENMTANYGYTSGLGVVTAVVRDQGLCYLSYRNPYDVGETVEENVDLLPFSDIWDIFSNLALLSIQHLEIDENLQKNELEIYQVRFGYMTLLQPDGSYRYTPVWDFYGRRYLAGTGTYGHAHEFDPIEGLSELTINAVNGTVIDRLLGY